MWATTADLPESARAVLPPVAQHIFKAAGNTAAERGEDAEVAAWAALRKAGYWRTGTGLWQPRMSKQHLRTLYVSRPLLQPDTLVRWAHRQGLPVTLEPSDLHVTIAYSRVPVDWDTLTESYTPELTVTGGPRFLVQFGTALVLRFSSGLLTWRHEELRDLGASWDHASYSPHVTLAYLEDGQVLPDLDTVTPYVGDLRFGRERFEQVDPAR